MMNLLFRGLSLMVASVIPVHAGIPLPHALSSSRKRGSRWCVGNGSDPSHEHCESPKATLEWGHGKVIPETHEQAQGAPVVAI